MPHEIADSDAESDFNSPPKPILTAHGTHEGGVSTPASQINFEEYMDPTQRLSFSSSNVQSGDKPTNSTIKLLDEIQDAHDALNVSPTDTRSTGSLNVSPIMRSKKRAHSVVNESSRASDYDASITASRIKRTKTYGHRSQSGGSEHNDLFATNSETLETPDKCTEQRTDDGMLRKATRFPDVVSDLDMARFSTVDYPKQTSRLDHPMPNSLQNITTSTASMGGYASINLNYRGSGEVDVNSNPFGSLSQVSADEDLNSLETERFTGMFHNDRSLLVPEQQAEDSHLTSGTHLLPQPPSAHQRWESSAPVNSLHDGNASRDESLNGHDGSHLAAPDLMHILPEMNVPEDPVPIKKRGRKPKSTTSLSEPAASIVPDQVMDEQSLPDLEPIRRSRQGTVDSISAASQASSSNKKSNRRKPKQLAKPEEAVDNQSPVKQLTSELNLSDEQFIGLPKENYKPRPSRSRSKKVPDEDEVVPFAKTVELTTETPAKHKALSIETSPKDAESPVTTTTSSTRKSGRKAKVKRAKTSGVALKLAEPMLSEGEEDVVWMDSKPAPVKIELPRDLKVLKKEDGQKYGREDSLEGEFGTIDGKSSNITIEIPLASDESAMKSAMKPVPKKRGRKPKNAQQDPEANKADHEVHTAENDRKPLAEKSSNISRSKARSSTPKAPTVSPLSSPEQEPEPTLQRMISPAKIITPTKHTAIEKGPTKHSPINPPSLLGSVGKKTLYRIGLSRRQNIPSLLRRVQRDKAPPKIVVAKDKEKKKKNAGDNGSDDDNDDDRREMRGADGMLVEWGD